MSNLNERKDAARFREKNKGSVVSINIYNKKKSTFIKIQNNNKVN